MNSEHFVDTHVPTHIHAIPCSDALERRQNSSAWQTCIGRLAGRAVCEALSDEEERDGAEIFRDEGSEGPQGPDVPEGAVAGVIVMQPDGSPCIGWLLAHPAIVRPPCFQLLCSCMYVLTLLEWRVTVPVFGAFYLENVDPSSCSKVAHNLKKPD